jgi:NAD(P)-dependent dehydrogenase (short-subunit alcohol dehydrogenase family)
MRLAGKRAVITGAAGGIGRETALLFAREGAAVAVADIDQAGAERVAAEIAASGGTARGVGVDVTSPESAAAMVQATVDAFGGLDVLFANAGVMLADDAGPEDTEMAVWERTLAVNLTGVFLSCKYAIPAMRAAGGGSIVTAGSIVAIMGAAVPQLAYTASKGGVVALTREIAVQYARQNIRANAICPGPIETPLTHMLFDTPEKLERRRVHMPMGRFGQAPEIAKLALFLASDEASFVTAAAYVVDGGITAAYVTPE